MDEIWVPTEFHRGIFERDGVDVERLHVLGEPVDTEFFDPRRARVDSNLVPSEAGGTTFLSVFKWEYRKGWDVLLRAFVSAFRRSDPVRLFILTHAYHSTGDFHAQIHRYLESHLNCRARGFVSRETRLAHGGGDGVHFSSTNASLPHPPDFCIDFHGFDPSGEEEEKEEEEFGVRRIPFRDLPRYFLLPTVAQEALPNVYKSVDAVVLPSRGEGWGRPHVEAMSMELPVIATNWSGPTAFLHARNGLPLAYTHLRPVPDGPFRGHAMAEPSERDLRAKMQWIVRNPMERRKLGVQAREEMVQRFHPSVLAAQVRSHIERIASDLACGDAQDEEPFACRQGRRMELGLGRSGRQERDEL